MIKPIDNIINTSDMMLTTRKEQLSDSRDRHLKQEVLIFIMSFLHYSMFLKKHNLLFLFSKQNSKKL